MNLIGKFNIKYKLKNPLLKSMLIYVFSDGITRALPFLVFPIVAFYLTTEEFGLVSNFQVFMSIIAPFVGLSTASYFSVEFYKEDNDIDKNFSNIIYFNLFALFIVSLFIIFSSNWIIDLTGLTKLWIWIAVLSIFFQLFSDLYLTRLRMEEKSKMFGIFNVSTSIIGASFTILFLVIFNWGWHGRLYGLIMQIFFGGALAIYFSRKYFKFVNKPDFKKMIEYLTFGLPLLPHTMSLWIRNGFEKLFITNSINLASNGVYSFALTISSVFTIFSGAFFSAFSPYVFKTLSEATKPVDSEKNLIKVKLEIVKKSYFFLLAYFIFLVIGFFVGYFIITLFFIDKYIEAINYLPYLLMYNFFNACYIFVSIVIYYSKSTKFLGVITITVSIIQLFLMMYLVKQIGPKGAAISAMLISVLTLILVYIYGNKVFPMPWLKPKLIFSDYSE